MSLSNSLWPTSADVPEDGPAHHLLVQQDADLDRRFLLARLLIGLGVGGYVAAAALVEHSAAPLLSVVATYLLANVGVFLVLCPLRDAWARWSFAALDVLFVLLMRYSSHLEPLADPNVTLAGLLALILFAYTLYGDARLTAVLALGAMVAAGGATWLDAHAALQVDVQSSAVQVYSLRATAVMGYLAMAALVSLALVLTIHRQKHRHVEAVEAQIDAFVQAGIERARRERVEDLDRLKLSFIDVLAHELRTPITPLTSALDLLDDDLHTLTAGADTCEMLDVARESAFQLQRLVHDYTRLAELLTSDLTFEDSRHNVALDRLLDALLEHRTIPNVRVDGLGGLVTAADPQLLTGALTALLRRAELLTAAGGLVHIYGDRHDSHVALKIHDPHSFIERLPESDLDDLFYANSERIFHSANTGLELVLARHSLRRLGGQLQVDSRTGHGTTVTCLLPPPLADAPLVDEASTTLFLQVAG